MVRLLHERLGFNVLALESGFFESPDVAAALASSRPIEQALALGVYPIYSLSAEMQPLFAYVRDHSASEHPIRYWGFDPQPSSATSGERLVAGLAGHLHELGHPLSPGDRAQLKRLVEAADVRRRSNLNEDAHRDNQLVVAKLTRLLSAHERSSFWLQSLQNLAAMEGSLYLRQGAPPFNPGDPQATLRHPLVVEGNNLRDLAMAESIQWILRADTSARIIVWAANNHVAYRHMQTSLPNDGETVERVPMGQHLRDSLGSDVFTILTISYEGNWALPGVERNGEWLWTSGTYPPASEGSLAHKLAEDGMEFAIADVRKQLSTYTDRHELFGGGDVRFGEFCDAVLFIRSMKPSTPFAE
jgi:erythromycin esterase-like protein